MRAAGAGHLASLLNEGIDRTGTGTNQEARLLEVLAPIGIARNPVGDQSGPGLREVVTSGAALSDSVIEGVPETLAMLRSAGKQLVFVTNNSTKSRAGYLKKFISLGLDVKAVRAPPSITIPTPASTMPRPTPTPPPRPLPSHACKLCGAFLGVP